MGLGRYSDEAIYKAFYSRVYSAISASQTNDTIPEPYTVLGQYSAFARLKSGDVVFDLGVYAGFTTIGFGRLVGPEGNVYGVEADPLNFETGSENLETARCFGAPENISLVPKAVWCHEEGVEFSSEGGMSSSAVSIVELDVVRS